MAEEETDAEQHEGEQKIIQPQKIFLKDVSFETPNSPEIFTLEWKPALNIEIESTAKSLPDDFYEVILTLTAKVSVAEKTAYLAEVHQAGIFTLKGFEPAELQQLQNIYCLRFLYPFASAALSELVLKGGFPQLLPGPINFERLYRQRMEAAQHSQATEASNSTPS